jgi:hypothetical protein
VAGAFEQRRGHDFNQSFFANALSCANFVDFDNDRDLTSFSPTKSPTSSR